MVKSYIFSTLNKSIPIASDYKKINDIKIIIKSIEQLRENDVLYIYDFDTKARFVIEIYTKSYVLSIMNFYKDFKKDELIEFLNHGFNIFKSIYSNPEAIGFIWEDDGGM